RYNAPPMVKQHSQIINFLMGICDLLVVTAAWASSYVFRFAFFPFEELPPLRNVFTNWLIVLLVSLVVIAGLVIERGFYRSGLRFMRRRGFNLRHALIVGTGRLGQSTFLRLQRNSWTG